MEFGFEMRAPRVRTEGVRWPARVRSPVLACAVAIGGALGAASAGRLVPDVVVGRVLAAVAAAVFVYAASLTRRWALVVPVAAGLLFAGNGPALVAACVAALGCLVAISVLPARDRILGAAIGVLVVVAFGDLRDGLFVGAPTLVVVASAVPVFVSANGVALPSVRRTAHRTLLGTGLAAGVCTIAGVIALQASAGAARDAIESAEAAIDVLKDGDSLGAMALFEDAERDFDRARSTAGGPVGTVARVVPVVGHHVDAVEVLAASGAEVAAVSVQSLEQADLDGITLVDGEIDPELLVALADPLNTVTDRLDQTARTVAGMPRTWLFGMRDETEDFDAELAAAVADARSASRVIGILPWLVGVDAPRTYLVLLTSPAESRDLGGFTGSVAVLRAERGRIALDEPFSADVVNAELRRRSAALPDISAHLRALDPSRFSQNWSGSADVRVAADVASTVWREVMGEDVDGVVVADPYTLAGLAQLTGPIEVDGVGVIAPADLVDFLLRGQYLAFEDRAERKDLLADIADATFSSVLDGRFASPRDLQRAFAPLVDARRLQFVAFDPDADALLSDFGLVTDLAPRTGSDALLVTQENTRVNKLDAYLERTIDFAVVQEEDGVTTATLVVEIQNNAPRNGLNDYVTGDGLGDGLAATTARINLSALSVMDLVGVQVDGERAPASTSPVAGLQRHTVPVTITAGARARVEYELRGLFDPDGYEVRAIPAATAVPDDLTVRLGVPGRTLITEPASIFDRERRYIVDRTGTADEI